MNFSLLFKISITIFILTINNISAELNDLKKILEEILNENQTYVHKNEDVSEELSVPGELSEEKNDENLTNIHENYPNIDYSSDIILEDFIELSSHHYISEEDPGYIWRIIVPEDNHQILLQFQYVISSNNSLKNCEENYIEVRNGLSSKAPLIQRFCEDFPMSIYSIGRELYIKLVNRGVNSRLQFAADVSNVLDRCHHSVHNCEHHCINTFQGYKCLCDEGFKLDSDGKNCTSKYKEYGTINHQMCENIHDTENYKCLWKILAPHNYRIIMNFTHFNLDEEHNDFYNCSENNHITILEKLENDTIKIEGPYCGPELPPIRLSKNNQIGIEYRTNKNTLISEFAVDYHIVKDECAFNNGGCPYECRKTIDSFKCFSCTDPDASNDYE